MESGRRRVRANNMAMAWSATSAVFTPGTLHAKIPSSAAAARSIESTPTPMRLTTLRFGHASSTRRFVKGFVPIVAPSTSRSRSMNSSSVLIGASTTSKPAASNRSTRLHGLCCIATFMCASPGVNEDQQLGAFCSVGARFAQLPMRDVSRIFFDG